MNVPTMRAVFKRDFWSFFGDPTGYVFILFFVLLCTGLAFFPEDFFVQNKANLDLLSDWLPWVLAVFVPAVTMASWSTEHRQGTDQLLLTLPALDHELVLAKYAACVASYTVALGFTGLCLLGVLVYLGSPDLGLLFATFVGYWLVGAALCAPGMLASSLTKNQTIAFIVGVALCLAFVALGKVGGLAAGPGKDVLVELGVPRRFEAFGRGVLALEDLVYFVAVGAAGLYGTTFVIGRRHWAGSAAVQSTHGGLRLLSIAAGGLALVLFVQQAGVRADVTSERMLALRPEARKVMAGLDPARPVTVEAWVSKDLPGEYVPTRDALLRMLDELDARAGDAVYTIVHEVDLFGEEAQRAEQLFGIKPERVQVKEGGRDTVAQVILGLAFTCGPRELVIPFFHRGLPIQYELTRALGSVAAADRKAVGIMTGGLNIFGGFDFQSMSRNPEWQVVGDLKKQYDVREVDGTAPIDTTLACLVVPMPSALPQEQLDRLAQYLYDGGKALLLCDPYPSVEPDKAPSRPPGAGRNPFMQQQAPETPRGDAQPLLRALGVAWAGDRLSWDAYNPHPKWEFPKEVVFTGPQGEGRPSSFNEEDPITAGLQEVAFIFPGYLEELAAGDVKHTRLVWTSPDSGSHAWGEMFQDSFFGLQPLPPDQREYVAGDKALTLALRTTGHLVAPRDGPGGMKQGTTSPATFDAIVVADLDVISDVVYSLRQQGQNEDRDLPELDNIGFVGNCIDALAGQADYLSLRKLRPRHRTLKRFEDYRAEQDKAQAKAVTEAKAETKKRLDEARARLQEKLKVIEDRTDLDGRTKRIMLAAAQEREQKKLDAETRRVEDEERAALRRSKSKLEADLKRERNRIRLLAVFLPPLPVLALALFVFLRKLVRERESTPAQRRRRAA